jgi:hypothetical protein
MVYLTPDASLRSLQPDACCEAPLTPLCEAPLTPLCEAPLTPLSEVSLQ